MTRYLFQRPDQPGRVPFGPDVERIDCADGYTEYRRKGTPVAVFETALLMEDA